MRSSARVEQWGKAALAVRAYGRRNLAIRNHLVEV